MSSFDNAGLNHLDDAEWVTTFNEDALANESGRGRVSGNGHVTGKEDDVSHVDSNGNALQHAIEPSDQHSDNHKTSGRSHDLDRSTSVKDDKRIPEIIRRQVLAPIRFFTVLWAMALVVGASAVIASALTPTILTVGDEALTIFFDVLYATSIVCLIVLLTLGMTRMLHSSHELRNDHRAIVFYKIGVVVLGTGSIMYDLIHIITHTSEEGVCDNGVVQSALSIAFILLEVGLFLSFSKTTINNGVVISVIGMWMTAQLIGTNISAWLFSVVAETQEGHATSSNASSEAHSVSGENSTAETTTTSCLKLSPLEEALAPYLFPLTVEYSVLAMTVAVGMWEKCGWQQPEYFIAPPEDYRSEVDSTSNASAKHERRRSSASSNQKPRYHNHHFGFALGWIVIIGSIVVIIVFLYFLYAGNGNYSATLGTVALSWDLSVKLLCLIATIVAMIQMRQLTVKTSPMIVRRRLRDKRPMAIDGISKINKRLDELLMIITFFSLFVAQVFKMIAFGYVDDGLVVADTAVSIAEGVMQTIFVVAYAESRRSTREEHLLEKPGRQALEFLRIGNLAMWCLETFLIKQSADRSTNPVFTSQTWVAVSNVTEPLAILFYFHSIGTVGELIHHAYTKKYIGLADDLPALNRSGFGSVSTNHEMDNTPTAIVLVRTPSKHALTALPRSVSTSSIYYSRQGSRMSTMKRMDSVATERT